MIKLEYPKCPHCGKKVSIWTAGYVSRWSEYNCDACGKKSFVKVKYSVFAFIRLLIITTTLIVLFADLFKDTFGTLEFYLIILTNSVCTTLIPCNAELVAQKDVVDIETKENI